MERALPNAPTHRRVAWRAGLQEGQVPWARKNKLQTNENDKLI